MGPERHVCPETWREEEPERRWALPDRIFFGHGACAILAGAFLRRPPFEGFHAERIIPAEDFSGNHIYVTNGVIAFDYHGYSSRGRLLKHHAKGWSSRDPGWHCTITKVDFDLLDTAQLNRRKILGPDQYLYDPVARAERFLQRRNHGEAAAKALAIAMR